MDRSHFSVPNVQRRSPSCSVFFTGVPLSVEKDMLRRHFDSVGHTADFRLIGPVPGKNFRYGMVSYLDEKTAEEAIARLNGATFGDRPIRVSAATQQRNIRKRRRDQVPLPNTANRPQTDREGRELMVFPRTMTDPILGRDDSIVLECLRGMTTDAAYEAVEQLRVLALERRHDAKLLLEENLALRSAVVMILQHAGRLPYGSLPAEAFQRSHTQTSRTQPQAPADNEKTAPVPPTRTTTDEQRDEVLQLIGNMSEDDVEKILTMSDADLAKVPDPAQRRQLEVLRNRLLEMSSEL